MELVITIICEFAVEFIAAKTPARIIPAIQGGINSKTIVGIMVSTSENDP